MQTEFTNLHNTRDLGGMMTGDGRTLRSGLLFRSGHLADLDRSDAKKLSSLIGTIIDFRTDAERQRQPDADLPGVQNIHLPIVDNLTAGISREAEADRSVFETLLLKPVEAKAYMQQMYRLFAGEFATSQYRRFLKILTESDGGILWHCTAGKDRAGIASVLVEEILGIPREQVIADYLITNTYLAEDIQFLTGFIKNQARTNSPLADESLRYLFGAEKEYLDAFYSAVSDRFGNFDTYLHEGLMLSGHMILRMREKYLEQHFF